MNENTKTMIFVAVAAIAVAAALIGRPHRVGSETPEAIGEVMFPELKDPADAQSLEIVEYAPDEGKVDSFSVVQRQGVWSIPSHENYPADARENLQAAATMFVDLEILDVVPADRDAQIEYGVVEPSTEAGSAIVGVGKLVRIKDSKGARLVEVIIGKEVPDREGQRFVRRPVEETIYAVSLPAEKLSTRFEDWVNQDVLDLEGMDITEIDIRDYSVTPVQTNRGIQFYQEQRLEMDVLWNADEFKWELGSLSEFRNDRLMPTELLDDEELDADVLDQLKSALADLKIVDVAAKPDALREGLKGNFAKIESDRAASGSLLERGFYPLEMSSGGVTFASTDGEVIVKTKDNIRYELYFGRVAGSEKDGDESSINRYVMIAANVDHDAIPKPEFQVVPENAGPEIPTSEDAEQAPVDDASAGADSDNGPSDQPGAADAQRDAIIKENQRKQDAYDEKIKKAEEKVAQLNLRLADWYYVISEDVYNQIHLARSDVVKVTEGSAEAGFGVDAFRELEDEGLQRESQEPDGGFSAPPGIPGISPAG